MVIKSEDYIKALDLLNKWKNFESPLDQTTEFLEKINVEGVLLQFPIFKVGDIVTVAPFTSTQFPNPGWTESMGQFVGEPCQIRAISKKPVSSTGSYLYDIELLDNNDFSFWWPQERITLLQQQTMF